MAAELVVIYDGECRFCRFGIGIVQRLDRRRVFDFCPFGHPLAESALRNVPEAERYEQMHLATPSGLLTGIDAARAMLIQLPFGGLTSALGLHRLYPLLVRYRWALGPLVPETQPAGTCGRPSEDIVSQRA